MSRLRIAVVDAVVEASKGLVDLLCACGHDAYWTEASGAASDYVLAHGADAVLVGMEVSGAGGCCMAESLRTAGYKGCIIALAPIDEGDEQTDASWFDYVWRKPLNATEVVAFALGGTWLPSAIWAESDAWLLCAQAIT